MYALAVYDDGSGPALYAGGTFTAAGNPLFFPNYIAKWTAAGWAGVGGGVSGGAPTSVNALQVFDDGTGPALFVGGSFTQAGPTVTVGNIARWNGQAWSSVAPFGDGVDGPAHALTVFDDGTGPSLYIGGNFGRTLSGLQSRALIAIRQQAWTPIGLTSGTVYALAPYSPEGPNELFVGGQYLSVPGFPLPGSPLLRRSGSQWSAVGGGLDYPLDNPRVSALCVATLPTGPRLFIGGFFNRAAGSPVSSIVSWDGSQFDALAGGVGGAGGSQVPSVQCLAAFDDGTGSKVFAGGTFTTAGGVSVSRIARWSGAAWAPLGFFGAGVSGGSPVVYALARGLGLSGGGVVLGGNFTAAGGLAVRNIARWQGCLAEPAPGGFALLNPTPEALGVPTATHLAWEASAGIGVRFDLRIASDPPLTLAVFERTGLSDTSLDVPAGVLAAGTRYYWRVTASNAGGQTAATPEIAAFTTLIPGDANGDGVVDFIDLNILLSNYGSSR